MGLLGHFVVAHRRWVLVFWLVVALAGIATIGTVTSRLSSAESIPGKSSYAAAQRILHIYGTQDDNPPDLLMFGLPPGERVQSAAGRAAIAQALAPLSRQRSLRVLSYANTRDLRLVSANGSSALALVFAKDNEPRSYDLAHEVRQAAPPGVSVSATSYSDLALGSQIHGLGVFAETLVGAVGALVILAIVFGSLLALLPLVVAVVSIMTTFLAIGAVTTVAPVSQLVEYLIALIGLGVAIDYSLLVVTRWREERGRGRPNAEAVEVAAATAGRTVAFSGVTVGIGLLSLVALPIPFMRSLGYAGILIPLVSVVVAVTALPALLATIGPRLEWPHRRRAHATRGASGAWAAWTRGVVRHRVLASLGALVFLGAFLVTAFQIRVGTVRPNSLSRSGQAESALVALEHDGFPVGALAPIEVLVPANDNPTTVAHRLSSLAGAYTAASPTGPEWQRKGTALVDLLPASPTTAPANEKLLRAVRSQLGTIAPGASATGFGLDELDWVHSLYGSAPLVLGLVALVTLLVLAFAFRSLLLPLKALALNVLSVGSVMGVLVVVWQHGLGSQFVWGVPATGAVVDFVPLMVFAFLFGLSMDYEVFIVSRMREAREAGAPTDDAVIEGLSYTGRLVTSAALILVLAFAALAAAPEVPLKMFATGLGAGILIDATVVRGLLLPAVVSLLGERAWSWPRAGRRMTPRTLMPNG